MIDDEMIWLDEFRHLMGDKYEVIGATSLADAWHAIESIPDIKLALVDLVLPAYEMNNNSNDFAGITLLDFINKKRPALPVIVFSAYLGDLRKNITNYGIYAFVSKAEATPDYLRDLVDKAIVQYEETLFREEQKTSMLDGIKQVLRDEIERYAPIKERTLHIPGEGRYELIKPLIGYRIDIERQLERFSYEKNVFLMMKFRESNQELGEFIIENLERNGLRGVRADLNEWNLTKNVYNPISVLYCCKYGIALFDEPEDHQAYSPNVAYELGMMHYQNKNCLILRHASLPQVPFDLIKDLYVTYERDLQVRKFIENWISQIAGLWVRGNNHER